MHKARNGEEQRLENVFRKLGRSRFRSGLRLNAKETLYLRQKGLREVLSHGRDFVEKRLAPALPPNDGKQTPWGGHPVFRAQHATATCCRSCLSKWHGIPRGRELAEPEIDYVLSVIETWLSARNGPRE